MGSAAEGVGPVISNINKLFIDIRQLKYR